MQLSDLIFWSGFGQLSILVASALVPFRLDWKNELASLPRLHWQMYWVYGAYIVLAIIAFSGISIGFSRELANGSGLSRAVCLYIAVFWGIRLGLQAVLDVKPYLTVWWIRGGYHVLSILFLSFTIIYSYAALG